MPLLIDMSICINCDTCIRHCPPQFGAIFNHGMDVIIIPELCSGCEKCIEPCPVDCIYPDPDWSPSPDHWWDEPATDDPYTSTPRPEHQEWCQPHPGDACSHRRRRRPRRFAITMVGPVWYWARRPQVAGSEASASC